MNTKSFLTALVVVVLALSAACSRGPDDTTIANDIKAKIFSDPDLKTTNVDVAVKDGTVTLSGELPSAEAQLKLYKLAEGTAGVLKVEDQMRVQGMEAAEAPAPCWSVSLLCGGCIRFQSPPGRGSARRNAPPGPPRRLSAAGFSDPVYARRHTCWPASRRRKR